MDPSKSRLREWKEHKAVQSDGSMPPSRPNLLKNPIQRLRAHSNSSEHKESTEAELAEGVWPRAKRDAKKSGTGTFSGGIILLLGTGTGVHLAGKDHAPHKPPSALVEIGFPVAGFIIAAIFILLLRLLLSFKVQRNEARLALTRGQHHIANLTADVGRLQKELEKRGELAPLVHGPAPGETYTGTYAGKDFRISNPLPKEQPPPETPEGQLGTAD
jgi:hypothetical protein